jgi:DNA polymerase-1
MKKILLIDGDVLVYKTAFASERVIDWGDGLHTLDSNSEEACQSVDAQLASIKQLLKADELVVALTCHDTVNFRKSFFPTYKDNRTVKRKPICWKALREHLVSKWDAKIKPNLEADDVLGIMSTMSHLGQQRIIVSIDKDFRTIPGLFYNLKDGKSGQVQEITEIEADYNFLMQTLTGDVVDNYPGCQGIGPKTAAKILAVASCKGDGGFPAMWKGVVEAYAKAGFGAEYVLNQARCARILRASDYDFKTKQPILWSPPA